mmetsp:Transcript_16730/g.42981  ORF Transcript_16730/g.42981 Transcript_16730/m.42981 type:complete len:145 (+) Transcript_16730:130-564(+)|eukprot:CAMPEP_0115866240 /NCGR_PEP_ID=MMETSP0287-20121206/20146_1 /TAXON_ID=412157 /ORGANISM="Chrysochromulina rotalis, Strain UIO044" /LENGTH=144 /DNA_ID=CAMNT_0003320799 /DNA_START=115 /DNA_END=549 /DNA_ORIENTATION=-
MADDEEYVESFMQGDDNELMAKIREREAACAPFLKPTGGNAAAALAKSLEDPPYQTRNADVKNASYEVVAKALAAIKEAEIEAAVETLSLEQCDVLMKYVYRGLGQPGKKTDAYASLLKWHPALLKRAGPASIVRAISEVKETL